MREEIKPIYNSEAAVSVEAGGPSEGRVHQIYHQMVLTPNYSRKLLSANVCEEYFWSRKAEDADESHRPQKL